MDKVQQLLSELKEKGLLRLEHGAWKLSDKIQQEPALDASTRRQVEWLCLVKNKYRLYQDYPSEYLTPAQLKGLIEYDVLPMLDDVLLEYVEVSRKAQKRRRIILFLGMIGGLLCLLIGYKYGFSPTVQEKQYQVILPSEKWVISMQKDTLGQPKYGFVDAEGNVKIDCIYESVMPFDQFGFARVELDGATYLIDQQNTRYPLAETLTAINEQTLAVQLVGQNLEELPAVLLEYPQVKILYLEGNLIQEIPNTIDRLKALNVLDVSHNQLTALPDEITQLKQLKYLDISNNKLKTIPSNLETMDSLKVVDISNNELEVVPEALVQQNSIVLHMGGNRMQYQKGSNSYRNDMPTVDKKTPSAKQPKLNEASSNTDYNIKRKREASEATTTKTFGTATTGTISNNTATKSKAKLWDCTNVFTKNYKGDDNHILESKYLLFFKKTDVFAGAYLTADNQTVLLHIDYTAAIENYKQPLDIDDKVMFLNKAGDKLLLSFQQAARKDDRQGAYNSVNQLSLSPADIQWFLQNKIHKVRVVNVAEKKMYPYTITAERQDDFQQAIGCIWQEMDQ